MKSLLLLVPLLILAGCQTQTQNTQTLDTNTKVSQTAENILEQTIERNALDSGKYEIYSAEARTAVAGEPHVVFFHANWCSWCRARDKEIIAAIDALPANTRILKANFDKDTDVRKEYGVTAKDTFVFVEANGEATLKNGSSVETIENFFINNEVTPGEERPEGLGNYMHYDADIVETFKGRKAYAYFFHADWCPSCVVEDAMIRDSIADRSLPKNTNIFQVDYDRAPNLRKQYGVTSQHSYVFFDKDGNHVETKRGVTKDDLIAYFN